MTARLLMFSDVFGFRELDKMPLVVTPGTYMRTSDEVNGKTVDLWQLMLRKKDRHGRNILMSWVVVTKDQLPPRLKIRALVLGIVL